MRYDEALVDPARFFDSPHAVLDDADLTREQKIELLRRWRHDALELQVAEAEGMAGGERARLQEIATALDSLGARHQ